MRAKDLTTNDLKAMDGLTRLRLGLARIDALREVAWLDELVEMDLGETMDQDVLRTIIELDIDLTPGECVWEELGKPMGRWEEL